MLKSIIESYLRGKRHKGKMRLVRMLMKLLPYKSIRSHYGVVLSNNPQDVTSILAVSGIYGYVISDHITSLPTDSIFIDIGANYGLYSNLAAKHLVEGQVLSFEPNPYTYRHFLLALDKNECRNILPFHCAIGNQEGRLKLSYSPKHSGLSSLSDDLSDGDQQIEVPVFNIANWRMLDFLKGSQRIHVKIDVEGFETSIIRLLREADWYPDIQTMVIEIDEKNLCAFGSSAAELYGILKEDGFEPKFGLNAEDHYDEIFKRS